MVVGPCNSDYIQWFYDKDTDTCQEFNYGGCHGNDNRFSDQSSCEQRCRRRPHVTQAPPVEHPEIITTYAPPDRRKYLNFTRKILIFIKLCYL